MPSGIQRLSPQVGPKQSLASRRTQPAPPPQAPGAREVPPRRAAPARGSRPAARTGGAGGRTHLAHKGRARLRREEALAGPGASAGAATGNSSGTGAPSLPTAPGGLLPTSRCPRGSKLALAGCGGAWGWGGGLMVAAGAGDRSSPGGRVPGARRGFTHGARRSRPRPRPRPARCRLARPPARNRFM